MIESFENFSHSDQSIIANHSHIVCQVIKHGHVLCNGTLFDLPEEKLSSDDVLFWAYLGIYVALIVIAGLMAGLTLALLSLDMTSLKVLQAAGNNENAKYAKRLIPLAKRRHLVLVTLVLANAFAVEAMPIFMDRISDPVTAILISCTAVLIFGEVIPQAVSSRFGLRVGYHLAWLVWGLVGLLFLISLPFSYLLDLILGKESGTFYGRKELEALVDIHGPPGARTQVPKRNPFSCATCANPGALNEERLTEDEVMIIKGALTMSSKIASTAMVRLDDVFMLSIDTVFDCQVMRAILDIGHSRIPIYENDRKNVLGVFLTKRLITIDPNQGITLRQLIEETSTGKAFYRGLRINEKMALYELLNRFQTGTSSHIAFVTRRNESGSEEVIGIVTLEDVIEELLQEEIFDESDIKRTHMRVVSLALPKIYRQLNAANKTISEMENGILIEANGSSSALQNAGDANCVNLPKIVVTSGQQDNNGVTKSMTNLRNSVNNLLDGVEKESNGRTEPTKLGCYDDFLDFLPRQCRLNSSSSTPAVPFCTNDGKETKEINEKP